MYILVKLLMKFWHNCKYNFLEMDLYLPYGVMALTCKSESLLSEGPSWTDSDSTVN